MTTASLKHINNKLKNLPDTLVVEVEKYIDFLTFKHAQENQEVPQWHKEIVLKRMKENQNPVDAFQMLDDLEADA
jgi:hypothetical protein